MTTPTRIERRAVDGRTVDVRVYEDRRYGHLTILVPSWFAEVPAPVLDKVEASLRVLGSRRSVWSCGHLVTARGPGIWCGHQRKLRCGRCYGGHVGRNPSACIVCGARPATQFGGLHLQLLDGALEVHTRKERAYFSSTLSFACIAMCDACRANHPPAPSHMP